MDKNILRAVFFVLIFSLPLGKGWGWALAQTSLKSQISNLQNDTDLAHASWSVCVLDVKKDSLIAEYNSAISLTPASTMKIVTTSCALSLLGWNFQYQTFIDYDGKLDSAKGILHGNLYIKGSGDPTLDSETFRKKSDTIPLTDQWAKIISSKGIKKIDGGIVADATAFEDETVPYGWIWGDMGNYYGAGASGINFKDNKFALFFQSGKKNGDTAIITKISPEIPQMKVLNFVRSKGYSDNAYIYGSPNALVRYVKGTIPINKVDYKIEGSVPDPPLFCAQSFDSSLRKIGIIIDKKASTRKNMFPPAEEFISTDISAAAFSTLAYTCQFSPHGEN